MHQAIYLPILSESTVKHVSCFFGCHHNQSRCFILDYNVLCWAVNRTILWEIHSRTHFCIITTKTYIEKKLCVPICRTGLVFRTKNMAHVCVLKSSFSWTFFWQYKNVTLASKNSLRKCSYYKVYTGMLTLTFLTKHSKDLQTFTQWQTLWTVQRSATWHNFDLMPIHSSCHGKWLKNNEFCICSRKCGLLRLVVF